MVSASRSSRRPSSGNSSTPKSSASTYGLILSSGISLRSIGDRYVDGSSVTLVPVWYWPMAGSTTSFAWSLGYGATRKAGSFTI